MELRGLALTAGGIAAVVALPLVIAFALAGRPDVVRGLLLGLVVGLLNSLVLARKLDRIIAGRDPWESLPRVMPRNMLVRFGMIVVVGALAARAQTVHLAALAGGIACYLLVALVYSGRAVSTRWRKEDGSPTYG